MDPTFTFGQRPTRRGFLRLTAGMAAVAALGRAAGSARAAEGSRTLLAVGISAVPGNTFCWRLVRDTASAFGTGEELERALGFVYVPDGSLLVRADDPVGSGLVRDGTGRLYPRSDPSAPGIGKPGFVLLLADRLGRAGRGHLRRGR